MRTAGLNFYQAVFATTDDPEISALAKLFVEEESEHVAELESGSARTKPAGPPPIDR